MPTTNAKEKPRRKRQRKYKFWCLYHADRDGNPHSEKKKVATYYDSIRRMKQHVQKWKANLAYVCIYEWDGTAYNNQIEKWNEHDGWYLP